MFNVGKHQDAWSQRLRSANMLFRQGFERKGMLAALKYWDYSLLFVVHRSVLHLLSIGIGSGQSDGAAFAVG